MKVCDSIGIREPEMKVPSADQLQIVTYQKSKRGPKLADNVLKSIHCCICKKWVLVPEKRRTSRCRPCHNAYQKAWCIKNPEKRKVYRRRTYYKDVAKSRTYSRLFKYKTSPIEIELRLKQQENRCAICKTDNWGKRGPQIDHCHKTDRIRGLLCLHCNVGLGSFKDSPIALVAAAKYLESSIFETDRVLE